MDVEVREGGSTLALTAGDRVLVRVPEPATTGYAWSVAELTGPLELEASELAAGGKAPGAAAERTVTLRATGDGEGRLVLALRRPWEPDATPADRFLLDVTVTG